MNSLPPLPCFPSQFRLASATALLFSVLLPPSKEREREENGPKNKMLFIGEIAPSSLVRRGEIISSGQASRSATWTCRGAACSKCRPDGSTRPRKISPATTNTRCTMPALQVAAVDRAAFSSFPFRLHPGRRDGTPRRARNVAQMLFSAAAAAAAEVTDGKGRLILRLRLRTAAR